MHAIKVQFGEGIADSAILALAQLIINRARLTVMSANTREQALSIIRSLRPAPSMRVPLSVLVKSATHIPVHPDEFCLSCGQPLPFGSLCHTLRLGGGTHISCSAVPDYAALCDAACTAVENL